MDNIQEFSPTVAVLNELASNYRGLTIDGIQDKEGLKRVHEARVHLKRYRIEITNVGKQLREKAIAHQKAVIAQEKELVAIIEPLEVELQEKEDAIEYEKEQIRRAEKLPERKAALAQDCVSVPHDAILLSMDDNEFLAYLNRGKADYLEAKEAALNKQAAELAAEKQRMADEKTKAERDEKARIEAVEREKAHKAEVEAAAAKAAENARQEAERAAAKAESDRKKADEDHARAETEERKRKEKRVAYKRFLDSHGWTEEHKDEFHIVQNGNTFTLYAKLGSVTIE